MKKMLFSFREVSIFRLLTLNPFVQKKRKKKNIKPYIGKEKTITCLEFFLMFHPEDEIITEKTSYIDEDGNVAPMTEEKALYFRTYEAEKVPAGEELEKCVLPEDDLILLAIVGIKDPCRPGVKDSVQLCQNAGVKVRMVTGDNVQTARAIALECGILTSDADASEPTLIEGKSFRAMTDAERDKISDKISVMGRLSPNDKLLLVQSLRRQGHVVAVTGDGTNDAPALHEADIGLAMGIAGTEVAKESSDIIILDDNFASVVKAGGEVHEYFSQRYEISTCRHQVLTKLDYSGTTSSLSSPNWWFCIVFVLLVGFALKGVLWLRNKFRSEPVDESEPVEESESDDEYVTGEESEPGEESESDDEYESCDEYEPVGYQKLESVVDEDEKPGNAEDPGNETVADASKPAKDGANELAISSKMTIPHRRDGVVYMGILGTYRLVAAVLLNPSLSSEDEIENERKLLCESDTHANIIRYYGLKKVDTFSYLCLERWVCCLDDLTHFAKKKLQKEPDSLDGIIDGQLWTEIGIPAPLMIQLMRNVVSAVNHLHSKQIIHRNLTPENVLICKEGDKIVAKLSGLGKNFGDANWRAPEQLKNGKESDSTDLFQLGCILFYAFTGHHPYGDEKDRGNNILQSSRVKVITSLLKNCEAACLIANLLERKQGSCSITASDAVQHPLFWDSDRRRNFLRDSVEYIMNLDFSAQVIKDLYARVGWRYAGWNKLLDADLVSRMGGTYDYSKVKELLRFIRNVISHYGEFKPEIQALSDGVEQYFALKFERLLMDVYTVISKNCKGDAKFRAYFLP